MMVNQIIKLFSLKVLINVVVVGDAVDAIIISDWLFKCTWAAAYSYHTHNARLKPVLM